jgi:hypothetical protein
MKFWSARPPAEIASRTFWVSVASTTFGSEYWYSYTMVSAMKVLPPPGSTTCPFTVMGVGCSWFSQEKAWK